MSGRIRSIKPEWLDDERMAMASSDARTLSISLMLLADDYGRGRANLTMLAGRVFPGVANPRETLANALGELARLSFVVLYDVDGQSYFAIRNWTKHQRVDKPGKPHVPPPPAESLHIHDVRESSRESRESSGESRESLAPDQDQEGIRKGERDARAPEEPPKPQPPRSTFEASFGTDDAERYSVAEAFSRARKAAGFGAWQKPATRYGKTWEALGAIAAALRESTDSYADFAAAMRGFLADEKAKSAGFPISYLAQDFGAYVARGTTTERADPLADARAAVRRTSAALRAADDARDRCAIDEREAAEEAYETARRASVAASRTLAELERRSA